MTRTFIEIVFEANQEYLKGFLQGYMTGKGVDFQYFFSHAAGVQAESLSEKIREWTSLSDKYQHLIAEKGLYEELQQSGALSDAKTAVIKTISVKTVKSCRFDVTVKEVSRDDSKAIKNLIKLRPSAVEMIDWQESEEVDKEAKGIELYTPAHEYQYKASGSFTGDVDVLIAFRQKLAEFSSVTAKEIKLELI